MPYRWIDTNYFGGHTAEQIVLYPEYTPRGVLEPVDYSVIPLAPASCGYHVTGVLQSLICTQRNGGGVGYNGQHGAELAALASWLLNPDYSIIFTREEIEALRFDPYFQPLSPFQHLFYEENFSGTDVPKRFFAQSGGTSYFNPLGKFVLIRDVACQSLNAGDVDVENSGGSVRLFHLYPFSEAQHGPELFTSERLKQFIQTEFAPDPVDAVAYQIIGAILNAVSFGILGTLMLQMVKMDAADLQRLLREMKSLEEIGIFIDVHTRCVLDAAPFGSGDYSSWVSDRVFDFSAGEGFIAPVQEAIILPPAFFVDFETANLYRELAGESALSQTEYDAIVSAPVQIPDGFASAADYIESFAPIAAQMADESSARVEVLREEFEEARPVSVVEPEDIPATMPTPSAPDQPSPFPVAGVVDTPPIAPQNSSKILLSLALLGLLFS